MSRESSELYAKAYQAHYKSNELEKALGLYYEVVATHPGSEESSYAKTQIQNITKAQYSELTDDDLKNLSQKLASKGTEIATLRYKLTELEKGLPGVIETQAKHLNSKWEYLRLTDPSDADLNILGDQGWEMANVASYKTGGGMTFDGIGGEKYTVHFQYAFKRKAPKPNDPELSHHLQKIEAAKNELERSKFQPD